MTKNKLVSVKADGSLNISIQSRLLESVRRTHAWYTSQPFTRFMLAAFVIIDISGFLQIANSTLTEGLLIRGIIISAFAVAFEVAPLYMGYAICLKSYGLGKPIRRIVFMLSTISFLLGIFANCIYRIKTMDIAYTTTLSDGTVTVSSVARPLTIVMIILPIITSLVNIVMGCLSFDPLLFEMFKLSKKLRVLKEKRRQLLAFIEEQKKDTEIESLIIEDEQNCYENAKREYSIIRQRLQNYIRIQSFEV